MADSSGQADIRGIDIDKLAKGFADEANILKNHVVMSSTKAREIRWYQKTSGFLDSADTTAVTLSRLSHVGSRALPVVVEQTWTRNTSYVKKFFVESPTFSIEDLKDTDIDLLATNVRDLVRAVGRRVDNRIHAILSDATVEGNPLTNGAVTVLNTAAIANWDVDATADPITDILNGQQVVRAQGYESKRMILGLNSIEHKRLLAFLINVKGSSIPNFSSEKVTSGVMMEFLGSDVIVSENFVTDFAYQWIPSRSVTWKAFMPLTSVVIDDPGIGKKIRVWEEGEAILTDPNSVHIISNTSS